MPLRVLGWGKRREDLPAMWWSSCPLVCEAFLLLALPLESAFPGGNWGLPLQPGIPPTLFWGDTSVFVALGMESSVMVGQNIVCGSSRWGAGKQGAKAHLWLGFGALLLSAIPIIIRYKWKLG